MDLISEWGGVTMTCEIVYPLPSNVTEQEPHLTGPTWEKWLVPEPAGRAEDLGLDLPGPLRIQEMMAG